MIFRPTYSYQRNLYCIKESEILQTSDTKVRFEVLIEVKNKIQDYGLRGYDVMYFGRSVPTFQRNLPTQSSE
jgi:hypothetical protein